jgi:hypothetical protein
MKNLSMKARRFLFISLLFLLIVPGIQNVFPFIELAPLKGAISQPEKKSFTLKEWLSGDYQIAEEKYINETFGFRSLFVRIDNQIAFSLFKRAKANGVIIGENNYLFEENYIKAYNGTDFIGTDSISLRMQKLKFISDTLAKLNKNIIIVFAAGKGSYYPEYFPKKMKMKPGKTNYEYYTKSAKDLGINYIDFNKYFVDNKHKSKYPLYPQYGIHWSNYGMCIAADSIIRYIEKIRNIDLPNLYWTQVDLAEAKESDYDIADGLNIKFKLRSFKMGYPRIQFESESGKTKPSVLVISDSFYWGMYGFGITKAFANNHFWYYNKQIYPESFEKPVETSQISLKDEIARHDVIIIMATEATLPKLGWGFIETLSDFFKGIKPTSKNDAEFQEKLNILRNNIKTDKNWMEKIAEKAANRKISVDSMLTLDAIYLIQQEEKK